MAQPVKDLVMSLQQLGSLLPREFPRALVAPPPPPKKGKKNVCPLLFFFTATLAANGSSQARG